MTKLPSWGWTENGEYWSTGYSTKAAAWEAAMSDGHKKFVVGYCDMTPFSMDNAAKWMQGFIDDPRSLEIAGYIASRFWDDNMWLDCEDGVMSEAFEDADPQEMRKELKQARDGAMFRDPTWTKFADDPLLKLEVKTIVSNWCRYYGIKSRMLDITREERFGYDTP